MKQHIKYIMLISGIFALINSYAQQPPLKPISYPIFSPFIINPAIAGSRDIGKADLTTKISGELGAQLATYNTRFKKPNILPGGASSFTNFAIGGYLFHDRFIGERNFGLGIATAYHLPLGINKTSALAIGIGGKGIYKIPVPDEVDFTPDLTPNADLGIYYYGPRGFIGISSINFLSAFSDTIANGSSSNYNSWQQNILAGVKFVLSRKNGIILEPSVLINFQELDFSDTTDGIVPYLKLYIQNACIGSYFRDLDNLAFFLQYQFPEIYTGVFVEFPRKQLLVSGDMLTIDLTIGLKLGNDRSSTPQSYKW